MKIKSILTAFLTVICLSALAQKNELNSAKANYEKFVQLKEAGSVALGKASILNAKTSIDKASINEKTMNDPSVWAYKALINAELALIDTTSTADKNFSDAQEAVQKTLSLDKEGTQKNNLKVVSDLSAQFFLNKGVKAYQTQQYASAFELFNQSLTYRPGDTTITYYSGLSAINAQNYPAAIEKYTALVETNFSSAPQLALDLSRLHALQKDTLKAIEVASKVSTKFNDVALATQEIELSLMSGKEKQVIDKINAQIAKEPGNKIYHFYLGIAYSAAKNYKKSEEAYKKCLEIDPNYEDAALNLGSTILNQGIDLYNAANKLPVSKQKEYDVAIKQANAEFDRAFPFLQKTVSINPKSIAGWENLKTYYVIKRNQAKIDEINKTLSTLR